MTFKSILQLSLTLLLSMLSVQCQILSKAMRIEVVEEMRECLHAHNILRGMHTTPPLEWDYQLEEAAQKWAVHLAMTNTFSHADGNFGENIWMIGPTNQPAACSSAISDWYNEIKQYNYQNPGYDSVTGHFSQVVWDTSKKLGVGIAYLKNKKKTIIVARYTPAGNSGDYKVHVHSSTSAHLPSVSELVPPGGHKFSYQQDIEFDPDVVPCKDNDAECASMKTKGYCLDSMYKSWMKDECYRTCGYCNANSPMPVDGGFSEWTSSVCSKSCGGGVLTKTRVCNNPAPRNSGMPCIGPSKISESCNAHACKTGCSSKNVATDCKKQAERGSCEKYLPYMKINCYETCFCNPDKYTSDCKRQNVEDNYKCEKQAITGKQCKGEFKSWMEKNCYASCNCKKKRSCPYRDLIAHCQKQVGLGWCTTHKPYMNKNCPNSCYCIPYAECPEKDVKDEKYCKGQAAVGSCKAYKDHMDKYCKRSCCENSRKELCVNKGDNNQCMKQAQAGRCAVQKYAAWMKINCYRSCFCSPFPEECGAVENLSNGLCKADCKDVAENCREQRDKGYCVAGKYVAWAKQNCRASCFYCN